MPVLNAAVAVGPHPSAGLHQQSVQRHVRSEQRHPQGSHSAGPSVFFQRGTCALQSAVV